MLVEFLQLGGLLLTPAPSYELHSRAVFFFEKGSLRGSWTVRKTRQRKSHPVAPTAAHLAKATICAETLICAAKKGDKKNNCVLVAVTLRFL